MKVRRSAVSDLWQYTLVFRRIFLTMNNLETRLCFVWILLLILTFRHARYNGKSRVLFYLSIYFVRVDLVWDVKLEAFVAFLWILRLLVLIRLL